MNLYADQWDVERRDVCEAGDSVYEFGQLVEKRKEKYSITSDYFESGPMMIRSALLYPRLKSWH